METIKLALIDRSYNIIAGENIIKAFGRNAARLKIGTDAYIITNEKIKRLYGNRIRKTMEGCGFSLRFRTVPDGEASKSIKTASSIIADIADYDQRRRIFIIAMGGGVIGDLSGFVASVYKRGVPYVQLPTTLLAQVDSAIGGKTGVDLAEGKNLIGAFYQPRLVFSEIGFLKTLSQRQARSGLAEVIKYGVIKDTALFSYLEDNYPDILRLKTGALEYIVCRCSRIKAKMVSADEREEKGVRTLLNFGHTAGHAIEAAGRYKLHNHGEAVALGMLVAAGISRRLGLLPESGVKRIENLIRAVGLPTRITGVTLSAVINAHYRDKKFLGKKNRFVLAKGISKAVIRENIPLEIIKDSLRERMRGSTALLRAAGKLDR
ncbi:MAG: 3-dehydroquinate synthase [Omnitrophica WOR_2 bacterium RIFCSPLOWO2_12_FULL_51_8]|nr:MAG: 3-dehydroquinate synthase [Omnitrophica WOR_2 bacterium RIFCSPLOWO2_12_FULL_51_8]